LELINRLETRKMPNATKLRRIFCALQNIQIHDTDFGLLKTGQLSSSESVSGSC